MAVRRGAHVLELRDQPPPPHPPLLGRAPPHPGALVDESVLLRRVPARLHPAAAAALEDRLAAQHRGIQALLLDNQRFAATHVALRQELDASRHERRVAAAAAARARAERDAEVRGVFERSLRAEAEARGVEGMRADLDHVRGDVQRLAAARDEHLDRLQSLKAELARVRAEIAQASALQIEIEAMQREIQKGRAAVEFEKKAHAENLEQSQVMESHMVSMAQEVEKLRAELANAEKRARAAAAAAVAANSGFVAAAPNTGIVASAANTGIVASAANPGMVASAANPGFVASATNPGIVASATNPGIVAAAINPGYVVTYGNPEMFYGGNAYGGNTYADAYSMRQAQMGGAEAYSQYGSLYVSQAPYDAQQTQEHK